MAGSVVSGNAHSYQVLLTSFQSALISPLTERCLMLSQLLQDSPLKELQYIFPTLVENIFGFRSAVDWGLLSLEKDVQNKEFDAVKKFLAPDGPVLRLVFKFIEEFSPKFEFPIMCLPVPSQLMLQEGKVPPLYANKLQIVNPGLFPSIVQLNAFEFYFFHFSYFIVNPTLKNSVSIVNQQDTLYANILEDYLYYFLPTDGRAIPLYHTPSSVQHSPVLTSSLSPGYGSPHAVTSNLHNNPTSPDFLTPVRPKSSLLKKGTVMMVASSVSSSPYGLGSSQTESWKSETFLLILKEIYLNQNSFDHQQNVLDLSIKMFVPNHYHVWMVRIMVKHLHFFFNSSLSSNHSSGHGQIMIDSLGRLKSLGMTQLIQKEIYCFLKATFDHWPLDATFRVPLETWLSYIQPWRYTQYDLDPAVWQKFMTENVLFYTSVFQQVLRRFLRMDLNCPKNAYMLYRLTKVFSMCDMREMIMQAEMGCILKPSNMGISYVHHRSQEKSFSFCKVSQLEPPGTYVSLFSEPVFKMVMHLLSAIAAAREKAQHLDSSKSKSNRDLISKVYSFFAKMEDAYNSDGSSPSDIRKVSSYLESSAKQLCQFFREVSPPTISSVLSLNTESKPGPSFHKTENVDESEFHNLSAVDRIQLLNKKKTPKVSYLGNPDLQPVRTFEIGVLVAVFNEMSQVLNEKYSSEIHQLYNSSSIWGKVCRCILSKPSVCYNIVKSSNMQSVSWDPVSLPPRINLRFLAHKQIIGYFFVMLTIGYWWGCNPILMILLFLLIITFVVFIIALLYPVPVENKRD